MNNKDVKGIAVISIADGEKLGTVDQAYVDQASKRIVGFAVGSGGGLLAADSAPAFKIDADEVQSLGPDALTLDRKLEVSGEQTNARYGELAELDELTQRKVVTEGGTFVGQVASVDFDERTFRLTEFEASPGFFKSNRRVPVDQVISVGADLVVVSNAVCAPETNATPANGVSLRTEGRFVVGDVKPTNQPSGASSGDRG